MRVELSRFKLGLPDEVIVAVSTGKGLDWVLRCPFGMISFSGRGNCLPRATYHSRIPSARCFRVSSYLVTFLFFESVGYYGIVLSLDSLFIYLFFFIFLFDFWVLFAGLA